MFVEKSITNYSSTNIIIYSYYKYFRRFTSRSVKFIYYINADNVLNCTNYVFQNIFFLFTKLKTNKSNLIFMYVKICKSAGHGKTFKPN